MSNDVTTEEAKEKEEAETKKVRYKMICPLCGSERLAPNGRCATCLDCGWGMCGV